MCQAATVGVDAVREMDGSKVILLRKISILRTLAPIITHSISHQVMEITSKIHHGIWYSDSFFPSSPSLYLLIVIPQLICLLPPPAPPPHLTWILVVTCFLVTKSLFFFVVSVGLLCLFRHNYLWIRNWLLLSLNIACQFHILKPWLWSPLLTWV